MFDYNHYLPTVRWKTAEQRAIRALPPHIKDQMTPIIEFVPKNVAKKSLEKLAIEVAKSWGWHRLTFFDFHLLNNAGFRVGIPRFIYKALGYEMIPVLSTGLSRSTDYQEGVRDALSASACGLCLRIHPYDFRAANIDGQISTLLDFFDIDRSSVHLIVDFQSICGETPNMTYWLGRVPSINEWRTLTLLSGAFPKDLSELEKNAQHLLQRTDFLAWKDHVDCASGRMGSFGDYTIQHGFFEEQEGKFRNFSASLRYTDSYDWVIMRGEGVQNDDGPGYQQYPANAALLCERDEFSGANYSWGDEYISTMSNSLDKTGRAQDWLAATINHHLTKTANQISGLSEALSKIAPSPV